MTTMRMRSVATCSVGAGPLIVLLSWVGLDYGWGWAMGVLAAVVLLGVVAVIRSKGTSHGIRT